jgi:hypothetical protein
MPLSSVNKTPLPFLNRFEKYTLSLQVRQAGVGVEWWYGDLL